MDRGFSGYYRGNNNQNFRRDDRRHDDFYSDRDRRSGGNFGGRHNRGSSRDQGFFGQQGNQDSGQNNSVIAALQLQNQNLLNAYIRNSQPRQSGFQQKKNYQGSGGFRVGDKRRPDNSGGPGFKRNRPSSSKSNAPPKRSSSSSSASRKRDPPKDEIKKEEELPDIPDDQVEVPDSLMDNVEKLRQRKDVERNVADEDIEKLVVFGFNGKGYQCLTCGLLLTKDAAFRNHLMAKGHIMNVIDARTAKKYQETRDILDIDLQPDGWYEKSEKAQKIILKQAKLIMKMEMDKKKRDEENYNKDPRNFFSVNMSSKKCATMKEDVVRITSIVESTIDVKEFSKNRFFGCEFVKAVASFQCRLCDTKIHNASEVIAHIDSRMHRNKYQMHIKRNVEYENSQMEQNKELGAVLQEHEGNPVLLSETSSFPAAGDEIREKTLIDELDSCMIRVPEILNPQEKVEEPKEEGEEEKNKESETNDGGEEKDDQAKENGEENDSTVAKVEEDDLKDGEHVQTPVDESENKEAEQNTEAKPQEENMEVSEENADEADENASLEMPTETPESKKPAKKTPKRGTAKRGRGTTKTTPRMRRKQVEEPAKEESPQPEQNEVEGEAEKEQEQNDEVNEEESHDGSFMDGFQVVDEVQDE